MVDALIQTLNDAGFQAVLLPHTGLTPPDLYGFYRPYLRRYGPLKEHCDKNVDFSIETSTYPNIEHVATTRKSYGVAAKFLEKALTCLGIIAPPSLNISFMGNSGVRFQFSGVMSKIVEPTQLFTILETFNQRAIPDEIIKNKQLHVAYEYLYADSLLMSRADDRDIEADVSAELSDLVNLGVDVGFKTHAKTTLSFSRPNSPPVAFAYKAGLLDHIDGRWQFYPERVKRGEGAAEEKEPFIAFKGGYLELEPERQGPRS